MFCNRDRNTRRPLLEPIIADLAASCRHSRCDEATGAGLANATGVLSAYICTAVGHRRFNMLCSMHFDQVCGAYEPWTGREAIE